LIKNHRKKNEMKLNKFYWIIKTGRIKRENDYFQVLSIKHVD